MLSTWAGLFTSYIDGSIHSSKVTGGLGDSHEIRQMLKQEEFVFQFSLPGPVRLLSSRCLCIAGSYDLFSDKVWLFFCFAWVAFPVLWSLFPRI